MNMNDRKIQAQLYKEIIEEAYESIFSETIELQSILARYLGNLLLRVPYPVSYTDELDLNGLLKLMKV